MVPFFNVCLRSRLVQPAPCNLAVSSAKAGVSKPQLLALLTPDIVQRVALTYLQKQNAGNMTQDVRNLRVYSMGTINRCLYDVVFGDKHMSTRSILRICTMVLS